MGTLLTLVVAVWLNAFLPNAKFEDTDAEVEESRHGFVLDAVKGAVQNGLDLGLTLDAPPNVQKLTTEEIAAAEGVPAMSVVDERGTELFRAGDVFPPADAGALPPPLTDNLGRTVGEARPYFSGEERARFRGRINEVTLTVTLIFAGAGASAILILGSRAATRPRMTPSVS